MEYAIPEGFEITYCKPGKARGLINLTARNRKSVSNGTRRCPNLYSKTTRTHKEMNKNEVCI